VPVVSVALGSTWPVGMRHGPHIEMWNRAETFGLQVNKGSPWAMALAAIRASYARAAGLRPAARSEAATTPKTRAASPSNATASKSASADDLLMSGVDRDDARSQVWERVEAVLNGWRTGGG
jgi:hypothetical protein